MSIQVTNVYKSFLQSGKKNHLEILKGLSFQLETGKTLAITGHSGSGKSTLLSLLAGLDQPSSGEILINNTAISHLNQNQLTRFRSMQIGIIFQQFHLMPHLTAIENVALPLDLVKRKDSLDLSKKALQQVQLSHRENHFPSQLSGGESQRVAIARAMVTNPALLLADEPTGNLDFETGEQIAELMFDLVDKNNSTLILVTHNQELAGRCNQTLKLSGGELIL